MEQVEKFNQIIDEVYKNYLSKINNGRIYPNSFTQEEFINKCKTDLDFSQKWGLKIEERVLSTQERNEWYQIHRNGNNPLTKSDWKFFELDQQNIPTKVITLIYQNETIETYEQ
jgi:hypothetical protein